MKLEAISQVSESFETVMLDVDRATVLFYGRLFSLDPAMCALFPVDFQTHGGRFLSTLSKMVTNLDVPETILPVVKELGRFHTHHGVQPHHYHIFGQAFIWMLSEMLGPTYNEELALAWEEAYHLLAGLMKEEGRNIK